MSGVDNPASVATATTTITVTDSNAEAPVTKYYYFGSQWIAMRKGAALYYLHSDHPSLCSLASAPQVQAGQVWLDLLNNRRNRRCWHGASTLPALRPGAQDERPGARVG